MKVENIREINTTALAYMGDAVYELAVREEMMKQGYYDVNRLHHIATLYVRASAQAKIIKTIRPDQAAHNIENAVHYVGDAEAHAEAVKQCEIIETEAKTK